MRTVNRRPSIPAGLLPALLSILAALAGYLLGDTGAVLRNAASVCLECIGVG